MALAILIAAIGGYAREAFKVSSLRKDARIWRPFHVFEAKSLAGQLRLALTSSSGLLETPCFGFAMSLAEMLQRYLPPALLLGQRCAAQSLRHPSGQAQHANDGAGHCVYGRCRPPLMDSLSDGRYAKAKRLLPGTLLLMITGNRQIAISILTATVQETDFEVDADGVAFAGASSPKPAMMAAASLSCLLAFGLCAGRWKVITHAEREAIHGLMPRRAFPS